MKLVNKISNRLLINSFIILIILGILSFFIIDYILENEVNEQLVKTKDMIIQNGIDSLSNVSSLTVSVEKVETAKFNSREVFKDTLILNLREKEDEEFRQITVYTKTNDGIYKITIRASLIEKEDLLLAILLAFLLVFLLMSLSLYLISKKTTKKIFQPFQEMLEQLKSFKLSAENSFVGSVSPIDEFNLLNENLISLTKRVSNEYRQVKEFTDNASHEIQTPLAVIKSKLDLLVQKETLDEEQKELIQSIYHNISKLTQLNKSLLLLARIEGNQFSETVRIDLRTLLENELSEFSELAALNGISVKTEIVSSPMVTANQTLLTIMIRNILSNAVKHNIKIGIIKVHLSQKYLNVENTGMQLKVEPEKLFERFSKSEDSSGSVGLGLAIVKQICELYNFKIGYTYESGFHKISIEFNEP